MKQIIYSLALVALCASFVRGQSSADPGKRREVFIGLNAGNMGFQDARFFKTTFKGLAGGVELGSRLVSPTVIRGGYMHFRAGIGKSKDADNGTTGFNLGVLHYEYLKGSGRGLYFGGQLDLMDVYLMSVSDLPNTAGLDINNTLMAKAAYRKSGSRGWTFHSGVALGLLSLHRSGRTSTFIVPEKALENGNFDFFNSLNDIASAKNFSFLTLGRLNKVSWRTELYKKRFVLSYSWDMLNYREARKPVTVFAHSFGVRYNLVSRVKR